MPPKLRGSGRLTGTPTTVIPGQWIKVKIPSDAWPLQMQIGRMAPVAAFLDRDTDGGVYAQIRCPQLGPGVYEVKTFTPETVIETSISVS